jgi:hypothetical protein
MVELTALADGCARALAGEPSAARMAVPFLHMRNAHPGTIARYAPLLSGRGPFRAALRSRAEGAAILAQAIREPAEQFLGDLLPASADVLFVSHFLSKASAQGAPDLYFGDAPARLASDGLASAVALINHVKAPARALMQGWRPSAIPRILLSRVAGVRRELRYGRALAAARHELRRDSARATGLDARILAHAAADAGSSGSRFALRIGEQIGALVARLRPRLLITTYEGHSWERLAYRRAREAMPGIVCIGYHHTVLFPLSDAMTRRFGSGYDPDAVVTAGIVTRDILRANSRLEGVPVEALGSVRVPDVFSAPGARADNRTCLVLPEGLLSESLNLASAAAAAAVACPHLTFRIRPHPLLSVDQVRAAIGRSGISARNLEWSTGVSLDDDLKRSRWALYRGTTAIIPAILSGLKPIYWGAGENLSIDPLSSLTAWRDDARSASDLAAILARDLAAGASERDAAFAVAADYCRRYFTPFDIDMLRGLVPAMGQPGAHT